MTLRTSEAIKRHFRSVLKSEHTPEPPHRRRRTSNSENISLSVQHSDLEGFGNTGSENEDEANGHEADLEDNDIEARLENEAVPHPIYTQGRIVYEDEFYKVYVKAVAHRQRTRYSLSDHLFDLKVIPKGSDNLPLLIDLEAILEKTLVHVLERLQKAYSSPTNQNQIYVTVLEQNILHGLNSGNYSLNTPPQKIARWILGMLYNYLKSNQTLQLNETFKIQIKVLSHRHTTDLQKTRSFNRHVYH